MSGHAEELGRLRLVFDASPLIALGKIGLLGALGEMSAACIVPEAVATEVFAGRDGDPAKEWLQGDPPATVVPVVASLAVAEWGLGAGESAVIAFASEHEGYAAVLDERAGRTCARAMGVEVRGTLGLLVLAKRMGEISSVRPYVEGLLEAGYRLAPALIAVVLEEAGER